MSEPRGTARELGYRMPAEFEPTDAVWLTYPHNTDTWPDCLDEARRQYDQIILHVDRHARVQVLGRDHHWPTDDSWMRDYGPIFVVNNQSPSPLACHDFIFNCWGDKYGPYDQDDVVPQHVAQHLRIPIWSHDLVLEGGSIEVNGRGTVMTTEQCLLNPNRNPTLSRDDIEQRLHDALGTHHVIWLPGGIEGDDTDGHIDDVARFVAPDIVVAIRADKGHPDHATLERNWSALQAARDPSGEALRLIALPVPQPIHYDYPADAFGPGGRKQLPASYANFLIVNGAVLVPTFGQANDEVALQALAQAIPDREIIGVRSDRLVVGLGAVHCLSMQQPGV